MILEERYNRAYGIAEFIAEGHNLDEVREEFRLSKRTIERELDFLAMHGYGKEAVKNGELYLKAKKQLNMNKSGLQKRSS